MKEKRFKLDLDYGPDGNIMDRKDKYGQYCRLYDFGEIGRQQIVDLLNKLDGENRELRNLLNQLVDENEQLKLLLKDAEDQVETLKESNKKYMESLVQLESED